MGSYAIDTEFFNEWTEESAYVLGYLFADACIYKGDGSRNEIIISSSRQETIELIKRLLGAGHPIKSIPPASYRMQIGSKTLVETLESFGLTENKVVNLTYPDVPEEFEPAFIRGYFDGKGSFLIENGRRITSNFSSASYQFIERLRDRLIHYGLNEANIHQYGDGDSSNQIRYYVRDTRRLYHLLYDQARIYSSEQRGRYDGGYRN
jgi:intein/homing endonuclease